MDQLPIEVLVHIFQFLDDESLKISEKVCFKWRKAIAEEKLYAKKCQKILQNNPKVYQSTFAHHKFSKEIKSNAENSQEFYYKLKNLKNRWQVENGQPRVYSFYCKSGEVSEEWIRKHNYTGVYDMVWLPDKSYLICSCYDTIQVWSMVDYTRVNVFEGNFSISTIFSHIRTLF